MRLEGKGHAYHQHLIQVESSALPCINGQNNTCMYSSSCSYLVLRADVYRALQSQYLEISNLICLTPPDHRTASAASRLCFISMLKEFYLDYKFAV